jgi:hypothetical protein
MLSYFQWPFGGNGANKDRIDSEILYIDLTLTN